MKTLNYIEKLQESANIFNSITCMGLDPVMEAYPEKFASKGIRAFPDYLEGVFKKMEEEAVFVSMFKPNKGFYMQHDDPMNKRFDGTVALVDVINLVRDYFPDAVLNLDLKEGDIGKSSANYAKALFNFDVDAGTVHGYMGTDSVMPFAEYTKKGKGIYTLVRTSNPGAEDFESQKMKDGHTLFEHVAEQLVDWAKYGSHGREKMVKWDHPMSGLGAVVGATNLSELGTVASYLTSHNIPVLIPGVGGQGGKGDEVMAKLIEVGYTLQDLALVRINSSSGLTQPWMKVKQPIPTVDDYAIEVVKSIDKLNKEINYKHVA